MAAGTGLGPQVDLDTSPNESGAWKSKKMSFSEVKGRYDGPALEAEILEFWREHDVFAKTLAHRAGGPRFVFHTAFDDPTVDPALPQRESVEVRAIAFFRPPLQPSTDPAQRARLDAYVRSVHPPEVTGLCRPLCVRSGLVVSFGSPC